jgi:hypothetical protein
MMIKMHDHSTCCCEKKNLLLADKDRRKKKEGLLNIHVEINLFAMTAF